MNDQGPSGLGPENEPGGIPNEVAEGGEEEDDEIINLPANATVKDLYDAIYEGSIDTDLFWDEMADYDPNASSKLFEVLTDDKLAQKNAFEILRDQEILGDNDQLPFITFEQS